MAPAPPISHDEVEKRIHKVLTSLFAVMMQTNGYDSNANMNSKEIISREMGFVVSALQEVHQAATASNALPSIPPELIQYVDAGRNPDIYTREFVEMVRKGNQMMKGKMDGFAAFRDVLAEEMGRVLPELGPDIERVLEETGGRRGVTVGSGSGTGIGAGAAVGPK